MTTTPDEPTPGPSEPDVSIPPPAHPPTDPSPADADPGSASSPAGPLPPLEHGVPERRFLTSGRLLAVGAIAVASLVAGIGVVLAGDDGDPGPVASIDVAPDDPDPSSGNGERLPDDADFEDALLEYTECMRDHGIDMPDPQFQEGGGVIVERTSDDGGPGLSPGPDDEDFMAAEDACGEILEDVRGEMTPPSPEEIAEMQDQLVAMAQCMRARGYDMPDPEVSGDGGVRVQVGSGAPGGDGDAPGDPEQFEQDQEECNEEAGLDGGPGIGIGDRREAGE